MVWAIMTQITLEVRSSVCSRWGEDQTMLPLASLTIIWTSWRLIRKVLLTIMAWVDSWSHIASQARLRSKAYASLLNLYQKTAPNFSSLPITTQSSSNCSSSSSKRRSVMCASMARCLRKLGTRGWKPFKPTAMYDAHSSPSWQPLKVLPWPQLPPSSLQSSPGRLQFSIRPRIVRIVLGRKTLSTSTTWTVAAQSMTWSFRSSMPSS